MTFDIEQITINRVKAVTEFRKLQCSVVDDNLPENVEDLSTQDRDNDEVHDRPPLL